MRRMAPEEIVTRFNACINARDADGLGQLMTAEHEFIDTAGATVRGNALLDGPALWTARTRDDKVAEWRVYEDSTENRARLGIA